MAEAHAKIVEKKIAKKKAEGKLDQVVDQLKGGIESKDKVNMFYSKPFEGYSKMLSILLSISGKSSKRFWYRWYGEETYGDW